MAGQRTMGTSLTLKKAGDEPTDLVLAHVTSIGEISVETEEIDVTTLDSPNGAKEYIQGAKDAGSCEVATNNCDDGQVEKLQAVFTAGTMRDWLITYASGGELPIKGFIQTLTFGEATTDGLQTANIAIRLSDVPVYQSAPSTGTGS